MTALNIASAKLITSSTGTLADALPVDMRVFVARVLNEMGFNEVVGAEIAPADRRALWWHDSIKTLKRFNSLSGTWSALTADQFAIHMIGRVMTSASTDTTVDDADTFPFYDASAEETKKISVAQLRTAINTGGMRLIVSATGIGAGTTVTLPGPFDVLVWQVAWSPLTETVSSVVYNTRLSGLIQTANTGWPSASESAYPWQLGMQQTDGGGYGGNGAGVLFSNGMSLRHRDDYTPDFPAQAFTPPSAGQNRFLRMGCFSNVTTSSSLTFGASIKVWGF